MAQCYNEILSSGDEDETEVQRRQRVINEGINYFETLDDVDFITRFHLSKNNHSHRILSN